MKYRELGKTGIRVSEIGFGSWAIGGCWGPQDNKDSIDALNCTLDLGCTFFDTALAYGDGHSEKLIGQVVKERKCLDEVVIATKVPPKNWVWSPPANQSIKEAFPKDWIIKCCEQSLKNLGRDYIDVLQLHTWNESWRNETDWHEAMQKLKDEGKILAIGISVSGGRPNEANKQVSQEKVDAIQAVYNILDQSPEEKLFPLAEKYGVGIIARVPLASGFLTGKFTKDTKFAKGDWRREAFDRQFNSLLEQVEKVKAVVDMPLHEAAIKFCLANDAVSSVIPGIRNAKQAEMNLNISNTKLTEEQIDKLHELWLTKEIGGFKYP